MRSNYTVKDSNILTSKEVCTLIKCDYRTLQRMIDKNEIPVLPKIGGMLRFSKKALNELFDNQLFV